MACEMCGITEGVTEETCANSVKITLCPKCHRLNRKMAWENAHEQWAADSEYGYYPEPLWNEDETEH